MGESAGQIKPGAPAATRAGRCHAVPAPGERPFHVAIAALALGLALAEARPMVVAGGSRRRRGHGGLPRGAAARGAVAQRAAARRDRRRAGARGRRGRRAEDPRDRRPRRAGCATERPSRFAPTCSPLRAPAPFGSSAEIAVVGGRLHGARLLLRIARWAPLPASAEPGSELALEGRLSALGKRPGDRPGSFDFAAYLRRRGIAGELMLEHARSRAPGAEEWPACSIVLARAPSGRSAPGWRPGTLRCCAAWCWGRTSGSARRSGRTFARAVSHICSPCRART